LISNTDYCIENCEAVLKVTTHEDTTNLFNEIEIWNLAKTKEEDIEEKNVLIRGATYTTEKDIYNVTCTGEKVIGEVQKDFGEKAKEFKGDDLRNANTLLSCNRKFNLFV